MAADIHSTLGSGARRYEHQLKAMSMCWQAFDPSSTYPSTAYPPTPSTAANAFHVPTVKNDQQVSQQLHQHHLASFAHQLSSFSFTPSPSSTPSKKKATPVPDDLKDEAIRKHFERLAFKAYRERRMKNNESARKSREMRRQKEESTQRRCDQLLHENSLLRAELSILRNQVEHFKHMLSVTATSQPFGTSTSQLP
ncbi:unnamed protein product [Toxocara canis]|uniref:BZIP domain-containing protein n=1 Tax=Toxocara canis TaxID=6265 RepID=A0A183TVN3_TOXCA|nr:unnamed protein product [Toxocara canis]